MTVPLSPQDAAAQLSAVAADLAAALADEATDPLAPVLLLDRACDLLDRLSWAMCREPAVVPVGGLREIARALAAELRADSKTTPAGDDALGLQAQAVGAQAGDLAVAYRSWAARGRCPAGALRDLVEGEVAHLLLSTAIFAELAGIDIDKAIGQQLTLRLSPGCGNRAPGARKDPALEAGGTGRS
jgi:hypothetical protein